MGRESVFTLVMLPPWVGLMSFYDKGCLCATYINRRSGWCCLNGSRLSGAPVFNEKWEVKDEQDRQPDGFQLDHVPRPWGQQVEQSREFRLVCNEKIIAS